MYIRRFYDTEKWAELKLESPFLEKFSIKVSNYGNMKRMLLETGIENDVKLLKTEGYPSSVFTVLTPIEEKVKHKLDVMRKEIRDLKKQIADLTISIATTPKKHPNFSNIGIELEEKKAIFSKIHSSYTKKYKKSEQKRKKTFSNLVHRLVAIHFLEKPTEKHNLVAHLDFDKCNNHHSNLKWMTRSENAVHQSNSPFVIKSKEKAFGQNKINGNSKLTITNVMIIKKRINEDVPLSILAKRFKISETQLLRIKRGENWARIPAAL